MNTQSTSLIIGAGGGKGGGGSARVAQEAPDSLRSKAYARVVDLVCEGEIEGLAAGLQSVYLDDTPIQNSDGSYNFTGVTLEVRTGTQQQSYIPGFSSVENEVSVGVECKFGQPVVRSITDPDVDAVRIKVSIPTLTLQDTTNGDLNGTSVTYAIDLQSRGAGYVQILQDTVSGKTSSRYQRSYYVPLSGTGPWDVRLRRITADSTQTSLQNKTFLESYTEVIESKLRYPNSALMALRVDASQFTSIPRRSYDLKLLRVRIPSNYFPETRSYAGVWDGSFKVAWTDNPAWCFYDLVTNTRYGLGNYTPESQVDKWALYRVAKYCDEFVPNGLGGYEPRFTCNLYLQTREQAYKVVQDMASVFRGMAYWSGGAITVTQDAPQDPAYQFTAANVVDGEFAYQGSSAKARHTVALVSWVDPDDFYRQKVEYVEDLAGIARYGVVQADVVAMGCTSRGQANRVGKWLLYSEQSESEIITFRTGLEGAVVRPGDVIKVADASRGGMRLGGRIAAATTVSVTLDQDLPAGSWRISVVLPTGVVEERQVGSLSGRTVGVTSAFSMAPQVGAIWVLSSTLVEAQLFRVVQVAESEPGIHEITALAHNPSKYAAIEQGLALQPRAITVLSTTPAAPTGLTVTESLYRVKDQALVLIQLGWEQVFGALEYQVTYRVNGGNTVTLPKVSSTYLEIRNAEAGDYVFTIRAVGVSGKLGNSTSLSQSILGKLQPPDDVQDFVVLRRTTDLLLSWSANTDADLSGYEVRVGTGWDSGVMVGQTAGTQLVHDQSESGQYNYHIRAFDTSGKYSQHVTTFQLTLLAPSSVRQFDVVQSANRLEFRWLPNPEPEVVAYELREGGAWDTSIFIAEVKSSSFTLPSGFDGERKFWIKAIASPGIYSEEATFVSTVVAQPQNANLLVTVDAQATRFPGVKHFASVESVNSLDVLRMDSGVTQSEYLFEVNLPTSYRAQNTLLASIGATLDDRETWTSANYAWISSAAKRQWTYDGALKSIEARFQMAREDALQAGELYGWRLNGVLGGYGNPVGAEAIGVGYGDGRYGIGVLVKDTTKVSWGVNIPGVFHVSFWFVPNQITTSVIWTATGAGVSLLVGYDSVAGTFFLEDQLFNRVVVAYPVNVADRICIGVCQTATERRLFIGKMGGEVQSASQPLAPTAGYSTLKLY
ncbi:MAG: phage tail protein [Limnohabitans sp.]|jgi:predicted phage tail protein|uniref:TipJ family phage tail tip protein n=1 Tax=Limnohabitans sp. TaxID=1907725 RepID=UPI003919274F